MAAAAMTKRDDGPMSLAFAEARSAELRGEAPIGAALVREGNVIASAGNLPFGSFVLSAVSCRIHG